MPRHCHNGPVMMAGHPLEDGEVLIQGQTSSAVNRSWDFGVVLSLASVRFKQDAM